MIINLNKLQKVIKKNSYLGFLSILIITSVSTTTFYNYKKEITNKNYKELIDNIYFQKSIKYVFNNLSPKLFLKAPCTKRILIPICLALVCVLLS